MVNLGSPSPDETNREEDPLAIQNRLRHDIRVAELMELGLMMVDGHFDYRNGYHGDSYLNPHVIMHDPAVFMRFTQELAQCIPGDVREQVEVVAGPITGGALLGSFLAVAIDSARTFGPDRKVLFAPVHKQDGELQLRRHYRTVIRGRRVLIADDVVNTGLTMTNLKSLVVRCGGTVIGTVSLFDRLATVVSLDHHWSLQECADPKSKPVLASECPFCRLGIPITQF